jgi:hypothetical protein
MPERRLLVAGVGTVLVMVALALAAAGLGLAAAVCGAIGAVLFVQALNFTRPGSPDSARQKVGALMSMWTLGSHKAYQEVERPRPTPGERLERMKPPDECAAEHARLLEIAAQAGREDSPPEQAARTVRVIAEIDQTGERLATDAGSEPARRYAGALRELVGRSRSNWASAIARAEKAGAQTERRLEHLRTRHEEVKTKAIEQFRALRAAGHEYHAAVNDLDAERVGPAARAFHQAWSEIEAEY